MSRLASHSLSALRRCIAHTVHRYSSRFGKADLYRFHCCLSRSSRLCSARSIEPWIPAVCLALFCMRPEWFRIHATKSCSFASGSCGYISNSRRESMPNIESNVPLDLEYTRSCALPNRWCLSHRTAQLHLSGGAVRDAMSISEDHQVVLSMFLQTFGFCRKFMLSDVLNSFPRSSSLRSSFSRACCSLPISTFSEMLEWTI